MYILLLGKTGQLGWELHRCLLPLGEIKALNYPEIDLSEPENLREVIRTFSPDIIINATAYTAVDKAESERDQAFAVNAVAPDVMAQEAKKLGAGLIHFSTDYVFDGQKGAPYVEADSPHPLNVYGASKLAGEQAIQEVGGGYLILRTAWVYSLRRDSFVTKVLKWAQAQETLRIVDDQISSPTWARLLAEITASLVAGGRNQLYDFLKAQSGIYHLAGKGSVSRLGWAKEILRSDPHPERQRVQKLEPASSSEFSTPATRPFFSALDCARFESTFHLRIPAWEESLQLAMQEQVL